MADQSGPTDSATLIEQYEQLRTIALGGHADGWRHGLGVLTGRGMAAWMRTTTRQASPATPPAARADPSPAAPPRGTATGEVVAVLAQMALAYV